MDVLELLTIVLRESATAALAIFAIWLLKRSYDVRDAERTMAAAAQIAERDSFAVRLEEINKVVIEKLSDVNQSLGANTEVLRQLLGKPKK